MGFMTHQPPPYDPTQLDPTELSNQIKNWGKALGYADVGISSTDLSQYEGGYFNWLDQKFHGEMHYMQTHGTKRTRPQELIPGTQSIISLRINYLESDAHNPLHQLQSPNHAYISRYALGRDYHKTLRQNLKQLVKQIQQYVPAAQCRIFVDSGPVLERPIAQQAGLGFIGKNSLIIHPRAGSWFFLAEIYTDLPLQPDAPFEKHGCGPCTACIQECPTQAIVANGVVDARRCISYLTIENKSSIPLEFRQAIGNRIYGCDDCQLVCPWNHFTQPQTQADFKPRHKLDQASLVELFQWTEQDFLQKLEGSPIRRIGYQNWLRNIAVALGNSEKSATTLSLLQSTLGQHGELVDEHINWAIEQQTSRPARINQNQSLKAPNPIKPKHAAKYYLPKAFH